MTDAQTEARAIWDAATEADMLADGDPVEIIATALAAKDAERDGWKKTATEYATELHSLRSQLAEVRKALGALDRMSRGVDWCDQDEQARRWEAARRVLEACGTTEAIEAVAASLSGTPPPIPGDTPK